MTWMLVRFGGEVKPIKAKERTKAREIKAKVRIKERTKEEKEEAEERAASRVASRFFWDRCNCTASAASVAGTAQVEAKTFP